MIGLERAHAFTHFGLFVGLGGLSAGLSRGHARVGTTTAMLECLGGIDCDAAALRDFETLTGVAGTRLDLFDREDYEAFHGKPPPDGWREVMPAEIRAAARGRCPDILHLSPPCKGFSGLLSARASASQKYSALNNLVLRGIVLALEAFVDDPPALILLENVPRIQDRGRALLDQVQGLLLHYGYATAETTHDCGELGGLAQHRKRFLLVARHRTKVRPFLYEPPRLRVRGVGEVLERLPMPDDARGGAMHRLPSLEWRTWVRLALIEAGKDWRSLSKLAVLDGYLRDVGLVPLERAWNHGVLGVMPWTAPSGVVTGGAAPSSGRFSVADPRVSDRDHGGGPLGVTPWTEPATTIAGESRPTNGRYAVADPRPPREIGRYEPYGVVAWADASGTVTGKAAPGAGNFAVQDPRVDSYGKHYGKLRVEGWDGPAHTVTGSDRVGSGAMSVADPRFRTVHHNNVFRLVRWDEPSGAVTAGWGPSSGAMSVADPRPGWSKTEDGDWSGGGHYGVVRWEAPSGAVVGHAQQDRGPWSVADRRLPGPTDKLSPSPVIVALDGTWHRPFTTLELAALQGLVDFETEGPLELDGRSESAKRERIGNAVPRYTAEAIGNVMAQTLLLERLSVTFALSATPLWVRELAIGLSVEPA